MAQRVDDLDAEELARIRVADVIRIRPQAQREAMQRAGDLLADRGDAPLVLARRRHRERQHVALAVVAAPDEAALEVGARISPADRRRRRTDLPRRQVRVGEAGRRRSERLGIGIRLHAGTGVDRDDLDGVIAGHDLIVDRRRDQMHLVRAIGLEEFGTPRPVGKLGAGALLEDAEAHVVRVLRVEVLHPHVQGLYAVRGRVVAVANQADPQHRGRGRRVADDEEAQEHDRQRADGDRRGRQREPALRRNGRHGLLGRREVERHQRHRPEHEVILQRAGREEQGDARREERQERQPLSVDRVGDDAEREHRGRDDRERPQIGRIDVGRGQLDDARPEGDQVAFHRRHDAA